MYLDSATSHGTHDQTRCKKCYLSTLKSIREDYAKRYLDLDQEARSLGWSKADVSGSVMEMQMEMDEVIAEWKANCGQDGEKEEQRLDAFAESIRFRFGPKSVADDDDNKAPFQFSAGKPQKGKFHPIEKAQSRALSRARPRKAAKLRVMSAVSSVSCKNVPAPPFRPLAKQMYHFSGNGMGPAFF